MYKSEKWANIELSKREDGTGILKGNILKSDIYFFCNLLITFGEEVFIKSPSELIECMKAKLNNILNQYN